MAVHGFNEEEVARRLKRMSENPGSRSGKLGGGIGGQQRDEPYPTVRRVMIGVVSQTITAATFLNDAPLSPYVSSPYYSSPYFGAGDDAAPPETGPTWQFGVGKVMVYRKSRDFDGIAETPPDFRNADANPYEAIVYNHSRIIFPADDNPLVLDSQTRFVTVVEDAWGTLWIVPIEDERIIIRFQTVDPKLEGELYTTAGLLDDNDELVTETEIIGEGEEAEEVTLPVEITVLDRDPAKFMLVNGAKGWGLRHPTLPKTYWILDADVPARWFEGPLLETWELTEEYGRVEFNLPTDPTEEEPEGTPGTEGIRWWGGPQHNLPPMTEEYVTEGEGGGTNQIIKIYDPYKLKHREMVKDEIVRGVWDNSRHQMVLDTLPSLSVRLRSTATVNPSMPTFTESSPSPLLGRNLPESTITVLNSPKLLSDGDPVYIVWDHTAGNALTNRYTTADMGNFVPALKGIKDWEAISGNPLPKALVHTEADKLAWTAVEIVLTQLSGFVSGNTNQVIGHDGTKAYWRTDLVGEGSGEGYELFSGCGIIIDENIISVDAQDLAGPGLLADVETGCQLLVHTGCGLEINEAGQVIVDLETIAGDGLDFLIASEICELFVNIDECTLKYVPDGDKKKIAVDLERLASYGLNYDEEDCTLFVSIGCGLSFDDDDNLIVYSEQLAGKGLEAREGADQCFLDVKIVEDCGLAFNEDDALILDLSAIAGVGLVPSPENECQIDVAYGCGLKIVEDALEVDNTDLAGPGLSPSGECGLGVNTGCGLDVIGDAVVVINTDLAGLGLVPGSGCSLDVNVDNCTLIIEADVVKVDLDALAGAGLVKEVGDGACALKVNYGCGLDVVADQLVVKPADLAGPGLVTNGLCGLAVNTGCGLDVVGDAVVVDPVDLAGNGLVPGTGCSLDINVDNCTLIVTADVLKVNLTALAGDGLVTQTGDGACALKVNYGCGLNIVSDQLVVKASDLAGPGLVTNGTCGLAVNVGCGLDVVGDAVVVDNYDLAGDGLVAGVGCQLDVAYSCGLTMNGGALEVDAADLVGDYLEEGDGCSLNVVNEVATFISEIGPLTLTLADGLLTVKLQYKTQQARIIELVGEPVSGEMESSVGTGPCPEETP